jgi:hypothetical protein
MSMWKVRPSSTHLLTVANLALFVYLFVQIPRVTAVRLVFKPRVPAGLSAGPVVAGMSPQRDLQFGGGGNPLEGSSPSNLFDGQQIRLPAAKLLSDGLEFRFSDPLFSLGVQRIDAFGIHGPLDLEFSVVDARGSSGSQPGTAEAWRDCPQRGGPVKVHVDGSVQAGRDQTLGVDTTPVWFMVPDATWDPYVSDRCDVSYSGRGRRTTLFPGSQPPRGGVDLSYGIEDELTGTPLPPDETVTVTARAVDEIAISGRSAVCTTRAKLDAPCLRELNALPSGRCTALWPVTVDMGRSVIHVSRVPGPPRACDLVVTVVPAHRDGPVHVAFLELFDSPREEP